MYSDDYVFAETEGPVENEDGLIVWPDDTPDRPDVKALVTTLRYKLLQERKGECGHAYEYRDPAEAQNTCAERQTNEALDALEAAVVESDDE